jgi:Collagen triple helix repeat (20 copies)
MRLAAIAVLGLALSAGVLYAKGPGPRVTQFTGCIQTKGDKLTARNFKLRQGPCLKGEQATSWPPPSAPGAAGPAGAQGPAGPRGFDGGRGPAGPAGAIGLPGAVGPAGPAGVAGATGPTGPTGVATVQRVQGPTEIGSGGMGTLSPISVAACPTGTTLVGGGFTQAGGTIAASFPNSAADSWQAQSANNTAAVVTFSVTAYALCASP